MKSIYVKIWKVWFRFLGKVLDRCRNNAINRPGYSPFKNKVMNWALPKQRYAQAKIYDLECPNCGYSQVEHVLEIRKIMDYSNPYDLQD